jgi:glycosyltransferase involved in cell wall biosynthesis
MAETAHISICVCTFWRMELLARLLESLSQQETDGLFSFSVVVADNDAQESARPVVDRLAAQLDVRVVYCVEPCQNIALARNKSLEHSKGEFVAFIDDDEFPHRDWLLRLFETCNKYGAAGVLGPVRPHFHDNAPDWLRRGGFFDRPEHETGFSMPWHECRTGNVLLRSSILRGINPVFLPEFGSGSEDVDFFRRMMAKGHTFVWCSQAVVFEHVPPQRWKRSVLIKRALLRGGNSLKHPEGRWLNVAKAVVAMPLYALALPLLLLAGQHLFMKYLVKLCDHGGRLMGLLGINLVRERAM